MYKPSRAQQKEREKQCTLTQCLLAEFVGTLLLTAVATAPVVIGQQSAEITHADKVVAPIAGDGHDLHCWQSVRSSFQSCCYSCICCSTRLSVASSARLLACTIGRSRSRRRLNLLAIRNRRARRRDVAPCRDWCCSGHRAVSNCTFAAGNYWYFKKSQNCRQQCRYRSRCHHKPVRHDCKSNQRCIYESRTLVRTSTSLRLLGHLVDIPDRSVLRGPAGSPLAVYAARTAQRGRN